MYKTRSSGETALFTFDFFLIGDGVRVRGHTMDFLGMYLFIFIYRWGSGRRSSSSSSSSDLLEDHNVVRLKRLSSSQLYEGVSLP